MLLCEFVTGNREEIISRCRSKTAKRVEISPAGLPNAQSDHGVPRFLDELVDELRFKPLANAEIRKTATQHGHDLMRQGLTVAQVVHGYGDVCQAITELAVENHTSISSDDFRMFNRALDDAIAAAVTQYGSERDKSLHAEADSETERVAVLAHQLRDSIQVSRTALNAIRSGSVGITGITGTVLEQSLLEASGLCERLLVADRRGTSAKTESS
jgi:hypothetical protein